MQSIEFQKNSEMTSLDKDYGCEICKDEGWIFNRDLNSARRCDCFERKKYENMLVESGVSNIIKEKTLDSYNPELFIDEDAREQAYINKEKVLRYIKEFRKNKDSIANSLALLGQVGSGKSHLAISVANELMNNNIGTLYMDYRDVMPRLKAVVNDSKVYQDEINKYKTATVLLIDDLFKGAVYKDSSGNRYINGSDNRIIFEIINYRYMNRSPIIVSSEYVIEEILILEESIGSRILEMCRGNIRQFTSNKGNFRIYKL